MQSSVRFRAAAIIAGMLVTAAANADSFRKVTTFAGDSKTFNEPHGVAVLPSGELLVSDTKNNRIQRVSTAGGITPFVGSGKSGSNDGTGAAAELKDPTGIAYDRARNVLYVADSGNHRIRKISIDGVVTTLPVAGLKRPSDVAVDEAGNLYVADTGHDVIRKIAPDGTMSIVAGIVNDDEDGPEQDDEQDNQYTDGPALQATFDAPSGLALTASGVLYIVDTKNDAVRKLEGGVVSTVAGGTRSGFADGADLSARFDRPTGIAIDHEGHLLVADTRNQRIRKITLGTSATVSTVAGTGSQGLVDGAPATARFKNPSGLAYAGALFIADAKNDVVRAMYPPVAIARVNPAVVAGAGIAIRVIGSGFVNGQTSVSLGTAPASPVTFVSPAEVAVNVPTLASAKYDVNVTTPGDSATLANGFTFDADPPVITAAVAPAPNGAGWNNTSVRVSFTCTDALSGIASCTAPVDVTTEGAANVVNGVAVDQAGNQRALAVTVKLDKGVPVIVAAVTPLPNAAGWTNADTTVRFDATDALSGVAGVTPPATITAETAGQEVSGRATDVAGNSAETSATVKLDRTAPAVTATAAPAPNADGWNKEDVTVTFAASDALSGITATDPPKTIAVEGSQEVIGAATDAAGNRGTASRTVSIDKTAPVIAPALSPAANAAGWNNSDVTVTFAASDALSGIATNTAPVVVSTEGKDIRVDGTATDKAGNTGTASATIQLDKTAPTVTLDPVIRSTTVYFPDVTLTGAAGDALSGLAGVTCDGLPAAVTAGAFQCTVTLPKGLHDVVITVTDVAGNSATAKRAYTFADDTRPPVIDAVANQILTDGWARRPVTVNFRCYDSETGIASCSDPVELGNDGANQTVTGTAVDKAGNSSQATLTVNIDATAPVISLDSLPAVVKATTLTIAGSASDTLSGLTKLTCNGVAATVSGTRFTCEVPLVVGLNDVVVEGFDRAGNDVRAHFAASLDTVAPTIEITSPATGAATGGAAVTVSGIAFDDDQLGAVTVNGIQADISGESFTAIVPLTDGSNTIQAVATDRGGNASTASIAVTRVIVPVIAIDQPIDLAVTNTATIDVRGTVAGAAGVSVNGVAASVSGDSFVASGIPLAQGRTVITAVATSATGRAASTSVNIYRDSIPPRVALHSPADGATVAQSPITVTGMIDDIVVGTINAGQMSVTVNGVSAQVSNRSFIATGIDLAPGQNTLTIIAIDEGRNAATATARVSYVTTGNKLTIVSGDAQTAVIGAALPAPLVVRLTDSAGGGLAGQTVTFRIAENNGMLTSGNESGRNVTATTDADGRAQVSWTLGSRAGAGNQRVTASAGGATAQLVASGTFGPGTLVVVDSGSGQLGAVAAELPRPLVAVVIDTGSNRLAQVPVTFSVLLGGGSFDGQQSITVLTDSDGRAIARPTLGPDPGHDNNVFMAAASSIEAPASFVASALVPGDPAHTRISGVVLDNSDLPIPGVSIRIDGTSLLTQSDAQGVFALTNVPVGYVKLFVDGSTATRPGAWPMLEYAMYTVPGADNTLGMPVYLLPIDTARGITVSETIGGTLTLPELPGFSLTVAPGAATFPGGARTGTVSVTLVHADKMPMPPGFGQQPRFIVTIQPPGVHFDPPAAMTLPNVDGLAPGEVTEMYSFDHDLGQFVAIGTASATDDGSIIRSDPGVGIIKGGWHCGGNPAASGTSANCGFCGRCVGTTCGPNPVRENQPCPSDGNPCTRDICRGGICRHEPLNTSGNIWLEAKFVNRDNPEADWSDAQPLPLGQAIYGGAFRDSVQWQVKLGPGVSATAYTWKAVGPTTISGPGGPIWQVDDINWQPGSYNVEVEVTLPTGCKIKRIWGQRVGVRTDDITVVGWINADNVALNAAGVDAGILLLFPPGGMGVPMSGPPLGQPLELRVLAGAYLFRLSQGVDEKPFSSDPTSDADGEYLVNWMFKYAPNDQPPMPEFSSDLQQQLFFTNTVNYKLYNRLQAKYQVSGGSITYVDAYRRGVAIGLTIDPITGILPFPGEAGPHNNEFILTQTEIHQVNDGTPDDKAVAAFNTLLAPLKWSHIGSKIRFRLGDPEAEVKQQIYPTYFVYKNKNLIDIRPQTPTPIPVFSLTPYPPGPPFPPFIYQP